MTLEGRTVGNYVVGPELGRGGMGAVHRATTAAPGPAGAAGSTVALKFFHPHLVADDQAFERFRREADIGMRIRHPNVVATYEIGTETLDGQAWHFLSMELIQGQTLRHLVGELGTVPEHLLFQIADQVLDALAAIHEVKVVHRDLKPENIVITREHRVLVMDLGVARLQQEGRTLTIAGQFLGSIPYAAPEQFFDIESVGERTDLYAFGVVLYELATGKNPFDAGDIPTILRLKMEGEVARPRQVNGDLDPFWDEVISILVSKEPSARFSSAPELRKILQEGEEGPWWRDRNRARPMPEAERALRRLRMQREAPLLGRAGELERLAACFAKTTAGQGGFCLVPGATGSGKSRVVYSFLENLASAGGPTMIAGRCVGAGGRAWQPFIEAAHDLLGIDEMEASGRRPALEQKLGALLADTPGVVGPMAEFLLGGIQPGADNSFPTDAMVSAYGNLLRAMAAERPVVCVIEDLHLAGPETVDLFGYLSRAAAGRKVLLVGVFREDEVEEGSPLHTLVAGASQRPEATVVPVPPLSWRATEELLASVLRNDRLVRTLHRPIHEKSEGNPLILFEILNHLRTSGALVPEGEGFALATTLSEVTLPSSLKDLISIKLGKLDHELRETLEAAAILGYEFQASILAAVVEEKKLVLLKRLAVLERKYRLLRSSGRDSFRFASRQLYEAAYESINPDLRTEYHSVVADAIAAANAESTPPPVAYQLVHHLLLAERALEADPHVEAALEHLAASYHASFAAPFLERLATGLVAGRPQTRYSIQMRLWAFYEMLGRRDEQMRALEAARDMAVQLRDPGKEGQVHSCLAVSFWRVGDFARAQEEAAKGLEMARTAQDRKWESNSLHTLGGVAWRRGDFAKAADYWRSSLAIRREIGDRRGEASSLQALAAVMPEVGEADKALETKLLSMRIFTEIGDRRGECAMHNNIGNSLMEEQRFEEAVAHFGKAIEIARELGDLPSEAFPAMNIGRAYTQLGSFDQARASFERALDIFRESNNVAGEIDALINLANICESVGEIEETRLHIDSAMRLAEKTGARHKLCEAHRLLGTLNHGEGDRRTGWMHLEKAQALARETKSPQSLFEVLLEMGKAAVAEEDYARAAPLLEEAYALVEGRSGGGVRTILALARLAVAQQGAGDAEKARKTAEEASRRLEAVPFVSPDVGPEIYYHLSRIFPGEERGRKYITTASEILTTRTRSIPVEAWRQHYLSRAWPNAAILEKAREG